MLIFCRSFDLNEYYSVRQSARIGRCWNIRRIPSVRFARDPLLSSPIGCSRCQCCCHLVAQQWIVSLRTSRQSQTLQASPSSSPSRKQWVGYCSAAALACFPTSRSFAMTLAWLFDMRAKPRSGRCRHTLCTSFLLLDIRPCAETSSCSRSIFSRSLFASSKSPSLLRLHCAFANCC